MAARRDEFGRFISGSGASVTVEDFTAGLNRLTDRRIEAALQALTIDATNEALDLVTAETVTEGATGAFKRRSEPGEPPFQDTGRLADSIAEARQVLGRGDRARGIVGSTVQYAVFLELGTRWMRPRPFLRPAMAETAKRSRAILRRVMRGRAV